MLKAKKKIKKIKETKYLRYISQNEVDKHDFNMMWLMEISKCLEKQLLIKCYVKKCLKLLKIGKGLASLIYNFFEKNSSGVAAKREFISTQQLAEQLKKVFKIYTHRYI